MPTPVELAANLITAASIVLAGRNNIHTWWTGIVGCVLFAWVFFGARLYADAGLQLFFIATSMAGWWNWQRGNKGKPTPVRWTRPAVVVAAALAGCVTAVVQARILAGHTDAAAPLPDAAVLGLSVVAQLLLMGRRVESWLFWLVVNAIAVPLFWSRGLHLTAALYAFYWANALVAFLHWRLQANR
jgi:nicotinamide mononucleotide transporter